MGKAVSHIEQEPRETELNRESELQGFASGSPQNCPRCGSSRLWKSGFYRNKQRWLCRDCAFRFSESSLKTPIELDIFSQTSKFSYPIHESSKNSVRRVNLAFEEASNGFSFSIRKDVTPQVASSPLSAVSAQRLNALPCYNSTCRVGATKAEGAKNLAETKTVKSGLEARQATKPTSAEVKGKIVEFAWWMKKEGYAESTIRMRSRNLRRLVKLGANLYHPESIKEIIAKQSSWNSSTKANIVDSYNTFARMLELTWKPPRYKQEKTFPFIPTEAEIDALIASCGNKTATFLQLLKETAMRSGEAFRLEWSNIDIERRLINLKHPEKGSNPRIFKVSSKLIDMLNHLPRKSKRVFGDITLGSLRSTFCHSRKKAAKKLANPRLLEIHFHTFRHWKATMEYHKTKDPYHVKQLLGHKSLRNTEVYITVEQAIFNEGDNSEYTTRIAKTVKGARALLEAGFEYVTDMDGFKLFRKRK